MGSLLSTLFVLLLPLVGFGSPSQDRAPIGASQEGKQAVFLPDSAYLALLPEDNSVPGWARGDDYRFLDPGSLNEYTGAASEIFPTFGYQRSINAEYTNPQESSRALVDIYYMETARNAFGIYMWELNPEADFKRIGVEGYVDKTALSFWSGPYYVKITVFQDSDHLRQEMVKLAESCSRKLGVPSTEPAEIGFFPRENQVPHSIRYIPKNVLGQKHLMEGFEARYRKEGIEGRVVIASMGNSKAAANAISQYQRFIKKEGKILLSLPSLADGGFSGRDKAHGFVVAVRNGSRVIVALGGASAEILLSLVNATLANLK